MAVQPPGAQPTVGLRRRVIWRSNQRTATNSMALYHYPDFPEDGEVTLCGCLYRVQAREGSLIFTEAAGVWGHTTSIRLDREDHAWRVSLHGEPTPVTARASHVVQAVAFAQQWFGDGMYEPIKPLPVAR